MKDNYFRGSIFLAVLSIFLLSGCATKPAPQQCELSLCDCKCHSPGSAPEEVSGGLCGIDCLAQTGVTGCAYVNGTCGEVYEQERVTCSSDSDCVRAQCCHPTSCVNKKFDPICNQACTDLCVGPMDCGAGKCACVSGACEIQDLTGKCSSDADCAVAASACADGVDPYHVCQGGSCVNLTFFADPCMMSHVCPKGSWDYSSGARCGHLGPCPSEGCDDGSNATEDVCVNAGTPDEACEYIVKGSTDCAADSDCVPEQCCHPTACMNKDYKTVCTLFCTDVCQGPIDCGAGQCACVGGKCAVESLK